MTIRLSATGRRAGGRAVWGAFAVPGAVAVGVRGHFSDVAACLWHSRRHPKLPKQTLTLLSDIHKARKQPEVAVAICNDARPIVDDRGARKIN